MPPGKGDNATYLLGYFVDLADYIKRDNFDLSHYPQHIFNSISRIRNEIVSSSPTRPAAT